MRKLIAALAFALLAGSAQAQQSHLKPYRLTAADAAVINARRPLDWPRLHAGAMYRVDTVNHLIIIPSRVPAHGGATLLIEDLEPQQ